MTNTSMTPITRIDVDEVLNNMNNKEYGGWVKVADVQDACMDPNHGPPTHISLQDGVYQHTCPGCKRVTTITVRNPRL